MLAHSMVPVTCLFKKTKPTGNCTSVLADELLICIMKCLFGYAGLIVGKGAMKRL